MTQDEEAGGSRRAGARYGIGSEVDYGFILDDSGTVLRIHGRGGNPTACTGVADLRPERFVWSDQKWTGRQLAGGVIYEMHIGTFTAEGTLAAAIGRIDHLVELGSTSSS